MPQLVEIGETGQYVEFPDGMSADDMRRELLRAKEAGVFDGIHSNSGGGSGVRPDPGQDSGDSGSSLLEKMAGAAEVAGSLATGVVAEPIAGLTGLALTPFGSDAAAHGVEYTRNLLSYSPETSEGKDMLRSVGEAVQPAAELFSETEEVLGDSVMRATNSPALAAAAKTLPTLVLELTSLGLAKGGIKATQSAARRQLLNQAAPSVDEIKDVSRAIYKEIDGLGARVKPQAMQRLAESVEQSAESAGGSRRTTPSAFAVIDDFRDVAESGVPVALDELDQLRTTAQNVAKGIDPAQTTPALAIIDTIDDFLDTAGRAALEAPTGAKIGKRYKAARELWGRARKAEVLDSAMDLAEDAASGIENGLRAQFRAILRNKKQRRFFNADEIDAMQQVVRGTKTANLTRLLGRVGFSEGQAHNMVGGALGVTAGAAVGGLPGVLTVAGIGTVSRHLAQRLTKNGAKFANEIVRSGKNAERIIKSYMRNTPKRLRDPAELAELLLDSEIDLPSVHKSALAQEAIELANQNRAGLAAVAAAGGNNEGG